MPVEARRSPVNGEALTRRIVELQGGTIGVESESGKGSTFTVLLPLVTAEVKAANGRA